MEGNFNCKNTKKTMLKLMVLGSTIFLICICILGLSELKYNNTEVGNKEEPITNKLVQNQLLIDFQNGEITTDEYVKYNIYAQYDKSMLENKYDKISNFENIEVLIKKYYNELSNETLQYYVEQVNLDNVTFELDKENTSSESEDENKIGLSDFFISKVYAKSNKVTNLNKAVLSKDGNFIVWYTTTGDSAADYDSAKKIADGLEVTVAKYDELFDCQYSYSVNFLSKGKKYENQLKILESSGIDTSYLESTMQIYLIEHESDALATYYAGYGILREIINKFVGGDENGSIVFPYIVIKPSSFSDFERLEQLYNHEMFHHYQYYVLAKKLNKEVGEDEYILDATANWASALITNKTTTKGYLNEWAGEARYFSSDLMSKELAKTYGTDYLAYALFVYLYNYSTEVEEGTEKIIQSIFENDSLKYLQENSTFSERQSTHFDMLLKNLSQNYTNKNLIVDKEFNNGVYSSGVFIKQTINNDTEVDNIKVNRLGIDYYKINKENSDFNFYIKGNNNSIKEVYAYLISEKDGVFNRVAWLKFDENEKLLGTINSIDYDNVYLVIANSSITEENHYSFRINKEEVVEVEDRGKYYVREINDDETYRLYIEGPKGFVSSNGELFAHNGFKKQINEENIRIRYYLDKTTTYEKEFYFEDYKQMFDENVEMGKYKNAKWYGTKTIVIGDKTIEYAKGTYEEGNLQIQYFDGQNVYDVVENENGKRIVKIQAKFEIGEWTVQISISSYENMNLTDEELLKMALDTTFVIEKE